MLGARVTVFARVSCLNPGIRIFWSLPAEWTYRWLCVRDRLPDPGARLVYIPLDGSELSLDDWSFFWTATNLMAQFPLSWVTSAIFSAFFYKTTRLGIPFPLSLAISPAFRIFVLRATN